MNANTFPRHHHCTVSVLERPMHAKIPYNYSCLLAILDPVTRVYIAHGGEKDATQLLSTFADKAKMGRRRGHSE